MALPRIDLPTYKITLPVSKTDVVFRAYTAREEKILLIAKEAGDVDQIPQAIKQIISNCSGIEDPDMLCEADRDYILVQLRSKVVGNIETLRYVCKADVDGAPCNSSLEVDVNLNDIKVHQEITSDIIPLTKSIGVRFKVPTLKLENLISSKNFTHEIDKIHARMYGSLVSIYDENTVTDVQDIPYLDFEDWLLDLPSHQYEMITKYFDNVPYISHTVETTCSKCKTVHKLTLRGIDDFFR
jgi:hypothetical protein